MAGWSKKDIEDKVFNYTNEELLRELVLMAAGDDFDGCLTAEGEYKLDCVQKEMQKRLTSFGFIEKDFKWYD